MKKRALFLAMVAALVAFAACNKEAAGPLSEEGAVEAVFEVSAPELATKAISDGLSADKLFFYLYDKNDALLFATNSSEEVDSSYPVKFTKIADKKWSVKVRLIKDMQYKIVFWAQKSGADAFTLDAAAKTLSVNYSNMTLNADDEDAFWGTVGTDPADPFIVDGPATKVVTLKRPFAQLNVAIPAEDLGVASFMLGKYSKSVAAITTNYTLSSYAYNTMNLLDGTVSDNAASSGLTLVAKAQPNADITIGDKTYKHMAMAYVLVGDKVTNTVTLTVNTGADAIGAAGVLTRDILNVPLQRNYRTNIIGNIFSVEEEFTVEVDNAFGETGTGAYGDVNVPDYVPTFGSIEALNAELAKGVNAVALDMTAVAGTINLPNTTEDIYLYILNDLSAAGNVLNVVYTEGAAAHPANLYIYAKNLKTLNGTVPDTHVEIYSYSHIDTGTISTSGTTLVIQPFAYYGNLTILKGALKVEGKIQQATLDPVDPSVPINVTIVKDAEKDINGQIVILDVTDGTTSVSTVNSEGGAPTVDPATVEADKPAVGTMNVTGGGSATVKENSTVSTMNVTGGSATVEGNSTVTTVNVTTGGSATVKENSTVTTVNQSGSGNVSISDNADVETVEADDPSKITGEGASDVEFLIKNEAQLTSAIDAEIANLKIGADFTCTRGYELAYDAVIDLNGYAITFVGIVGDGREYVAENFTQSRAFKITGEADFTLKNGKVLLNDALLGAVRFDSKGTLTMKDVFTDNYRGWGLNVKLEDGTAVLENVTIDSHIGGGIEVNGPAVATLTNCKFTQTSVDVEPWISTAVSVAYGGKLTIVSGTYSGTYGAYVYSSGGTINLNGGSVAGDSASIMIQKDNTTYTEHNAIVNIIEGVTSTGKLEADNANCILNISGGEFNKGEAEKLIDIKPVASANITGGSFSDDPTEYLPEGYSAVLTNERYVVGLTPTTFNVSTPEEFVNVFSSNAIITKNTYININADIDLTSSDAHSPVSISNYDKANITINGNNHTIKGMKKALIAYGFVASVSVNNLTIKDSEIDDSYPGYCAVIIAYNDAGKYLNVENVVIDNCKLTGTNYVGAIYGAGGGYGNQNDGPVHMGAVVKNCSITNCEFTSPKGSVGAIAGHAAWNNWTKLTVEGCSVENCTLTTGKLNKAGSYFGTVGVAGGTVYGRDCGIYVKNCTWSGNNAVAKDVKSPYIFGRVASKGGELYVWENGDYVLAAHNYVDGEENDVVDRADLVTE